MPSEIWDIVAPIWPALLATFGLFFVVGFFAQLIDGAVGMAYGVISSSVLLAFGVTPAQVSASVHIAECFTTGASGLSHLAHRNIDWRLFLRLAPAGILGGVLGAYVLTGLEVTAIKALVMAYLGILGCFLLFRAVRGLVDTPPHLTHVVPIGFFGGFLDASGGGGWGPVVTTNLLGRGHAPRYAIGSVNTAEFFVTIAISAAFIVTIITGRMEVTNREFVSGAAAIIGLVLGGLLAAPLAGYVTKVAPARLLLGAAAVLVISISIWQGIQVWPSLMEQLREGAVRFQH
jgi:hypothetical protein